MIWPIAALILLLLSVMLSPMIADALSTDTAELRKQYPDSKTVEVMGHTMAYKELGAGFPLILIHGFTYSSQCWEQNMEALACAGFKVYAVDLFGHGLSDKPRGMDYGHPFHTFAGQVLHFMKRLQIEKAHVLGHSMGGGVSIKLACDHPERVDRLVLIGSTGIHIEPATNNAFVSLLETPLVGEFLKLFETRKMTKRVLSTITFNHQFKITPDYLDRYIAATRTKGYSRAFFGELRWLRSYGRKGGNLTECLRTIRKKTLIINGVKDRLVSVEAGRRMHELVKDSEFHEIEGAPHSLMESHATQVNDLLVTFLTDLTDKK
jgi:2-hydroxymuconate-semialdehyde hydrolase